MVPRCKDYLRDKQSDQLKFWPYQISFFFLMVHSVHSLMMKVGDFGN